MLTPVCISVIQIHKSTNMDRYTFVKAIQFVTLKKLPLQLITSFLQHLTPCH